MSLASSPLAVKKLKGKGKRTKGKAKEQSKRPMLKRKDKRHSPGQWSLQYNAMIKLAYYQLTIRNLSVPLTQSNGVYTFLFFPSHVTTQTRNSIWRMVWRIWLSDVGLRGCGPPSLGLKTVSKLLRRMHHFHHRSSNSHEYIPKSRISNAPIMHNTWGHEFVGIIQK